MPIDTSIYGNIRPIQLDNPLNNYAQITGIQNAQNQNRLADIQYRQAMQAEQDDAATREAISGAGGDYSAARNALMSRGLYKPAMAIDKQNLDTRKTQAEITEKDLAAAGKRYETWSSAMAPLINKPDLSHDDILAVGTQLERAGVIQPGWKADVPMNALQLPDYVKGVAMRAEQGRKAVEMMLPKVQMVDSGGSITPWNTNTMAGAVGPLAGAQPVTKVATPGEVLTDTRTRSEGAANRGVTLRGQNLADARAKQTLEEGRNQVITDNNGNILVVNKNTGLGKNATDASGAPLQGKNNLTESQGKATGLGMRAREAADKIDALEQSGTYGGASNVKEGIRAGLERIPAVGTALGNTVGGALNPLMTGNQQKYEQAKRDFINAVLRVESGASIAQSEFDNADRQYFPQTGDSKSVIEQKKNNRETAIRALAAQSGSGAKQFNSATSAAAPSGVDPKLWAAMTPEERKLWQK